MTKSRMTPPEMDQQFTDSTVAQIENISHQFGTVPVLADINMRLVSGVITVVVGRNGGGKSTLAKIIAGLIPPQSGQIRQFSIAKRPFVGLSPQEVDQSLLSWRNNRDNIALGLCAMGSSWQDARQRVDAFVEQYHLPVPLNQFPGTSSGGQRQMVAVVRSAILNPQLWVLDEPFSRIDPFRLEQWQQFVLTFTREAGIATLVITHNLDEALVLADVVRVLRSDVGPSTGGSTLSAEQWLDTDRDKSPTSIFEPSYLTLRRKIVDEMVD